MSENEIYPKGTLQEWFDDNPSTWCQGASRKLEGDKVISCCLIGAVSMVYKEWPDIFRVDEKIRKHLGYVCISLWNDDPKRTFEDIKALVKELNI